MCWRWYLYSFLPIKVQKSTESAARILQYSSMLVDSTMPWKSCNWQYSFYAAWIYIPYIEWLFDDIQTCSVYRLYVLTIVYCINCQEKLKHLSVRGRHKELRLTVRCTRPLPKLGWSECCLLTASHTMHTDVCRHSGRFSKEEDGNFSVTVNDQSGYSLNRPSAKIGVV